MLKRDFVPDTTTKGKTDFIQATAVREREISVQN